MSSNHKWALGLSGGGLRSCSASAIFCLAAMHTQIQNSSENLASSTQSGDDNDNDEEKSESEETSSTLWDKFSRVIGISGGSWFVSAFQAGAFRNLNESYSIDELLDVLQLSVVYSGDSLNRQEKIAHYLGKQSGVNIYHRDGVEEKVDTADATSTTRDGQRSEEKTEFVEKHDNNNNNIGGDVGKNNNNNSISFTQRLLQHRDHLANSARNAIRSGFVNSVLRPVASILDNKFGEGVVIAVTSDTPLEEYQKYLKQRLLLVNNNTHNEVATSSENQIPSRNNSTSFSFGSIPSREDLFQTDEDGDDQKNGKKNKQRKNNSSSKKSSNKELWMTCIGSEDPALSRVVTYTPGNDTDDVDSKLFKQPEWNPVSIKAASRSSWIAFSVSPSSSSSSSSSSATVFQISLFEEEIKAALPYQSKSNPMTEAAGKNNVSNNNRYKIQKRELIPLEPLNLERMCAFCGSAFSASASNILDHAVSNGLGTMLSSISATFFGKERHDQVHSSPVLGTKTVDAVKFFRNNTIMNDAEHDDENVDIHHRRDQQPLRQQQREGEELTIGLRDAGLEVNIPFLFLETDVFNVAFALDSGSDAEVGRQILWAQRRGHLGDYVPVFSPMEAKKISRIENEENETRKFLENNAEQATQNHNNQNNDKTNHENGSSSTAKQMWQIYLKDKSSDLGPSVIVYLIGLDDSELMEVKNVEARLKKLKNRYEELKHEMKVITNWLTERGF